MNAVVKELDIEPEAENSPQTVSEMMAKMFEIRDKRKKLSDEDKELIAEWEALEAQLLAKLDEQGSVRVSSKLGTASVAKQELPLIEDWDAVNDWIYENRALHLLQRRMAVGAYRELLVAALAEAGIEDLESIKEGQEIPVVVPGTRPIIKKSINLRAS